MFGRRIHRTVLVLLLLMGALPFADAEAAQARRGRAATLEERSTPGWLQSMLDLMRALVKQRHGGPPPGQDHPVGHPRGNPEEGSGICPHGCPQG